MYHYGTRVAQDYAEAVKWYRKAAEQGNDHAQLSLGSMYFQGKGVPAGPSQGVGVVPALGRSWECPAQHSLGLAYVNGESIPKDFVLAWMWLNLAAAQGDKDAAEARDTTSQAMTPDQVAKAQRLAREWKPKTQP